MEATGCVPHQARIAERAHVQVDFAPDRLYGLCCAQRLLELGLGRVYVHRLLAGRDDGKLDDDRESYCWRGRARRGSGRCGRRRRQGLSLLGGDPIEGADERARVGRRCRVLSERGRKPFARSCRTHVERSLE